MMLNGKQILLGVSGGIAVYRVAELARMLVRAGASVRCIMTDSACKFVTPLTFEALTGHPVHTELFDLTAEREMGHIRLAREADAIIIAPATANLIAKLAHGIADDLLTTTMLVAETPLLLVPAMNHSMWHADATQRNIATLKARDITIVDPEAGELACGERGEGRLAELRTIISALLPIISEQSLAGQHWVINAGPTSEPWDDVRILTNRASGTLGAMLADLALIRGAKATLVAGPGTPGTHPDVERHDVQTAAEMLAACEQAAAGSDLFIATAAVSDFRFAEPQTGKLKRGDTEAMQVEMRANPDIVAQIASMEHRPHHIVAFAAESCDHIAHAREKLLRKGVDAIIANDIANMSSETAAGTWITADDQRPIERLPKIAFAKHIIDYISEI